MLITTAVKPLRDMLAHMSVIVKNNVVNEMKDNIRLSVEPHLYFATLFATNFDMSFVHRIEINGALTITEAAAYIVPLSPLFDFLRSADKEASVTIWEEIDETTRTISDFDAEGDKCGTHEVIENVVKLVFKVGNARIVLPTFDTETYPPLPPVIKSDSKFIGGIMEASTFSDAIKRVLPAAAKEDNRPILTGINLHVEKSQLRFAGADGFRLHVDWGFNVYTNIESLDVNVPAEALRWLLRVLPKDCDDLWINFSEEMINGLVIHVISFSFGADRFDVQLIEGKYPDFLQIIPKETAIAVTMNRAELLDAIKAAQKHIGRDYWTRGVFIDLRYEAMNEGSVIVTLYADSSDARRGAYEITLTGKGDLDLSGAKIWVNTELMIDALNVMANDTVELLTNVDTQGGSDYAPGRCKSPIMFTEPDRMTTVIMPMVKYTEEPKLSRLQPATVAEVAA